MKNASRISARRVLQGGAAFAALGALSLATAMPAHADTYGWAYATALGADEATQTFITQEQTETGSFSGSIGNWLTVEGTTTATVNSSGATGTAVVDTARIVITEADLPGILNPGDEDGETDDGNENDDENDDEEPTEPETPDDSEGGSENDDEDGTGTPGGEGTDQPGGPSDGPTDAPTDEPTVDPTAPAEDDEDDEDKDAEIASADVIDLDEVDSELVDNGSDILLEATVHGASVSTSQTWGGAVSHNFNGGTRGASVLSADVDGEEVVLEVDLQPATAVFESEDAGFVWNDAITDLYITFSVEDEVVAGYLIAESAAGITTGVIGDGGDNGGDNGSDGKNPPQKERDKDSLPKTEVKDAEPLAQTGSPLLGLIAAGAAIAAGGGAAAYLARRKKNNEEVAETETDETNEN